MLGAYSVPRTTDSFNFVDISYSGTVNFLLQYTPDAI